MNTSLGGFIPPINDEFDIISQVGRGGYGNVFKAVENSTGDVVALKKVNTFNTHSGLPLAYYREVKCLKELKESDNVLNIRRVIKSEDEHCLYLVLDYCEYDLSGLIHKHGLSADQIKSYMKQILLGTQAIHSKGFVHRDFKPSNILVTKNNVLKIADFGLARKLDKNRPLTPKVMTQSYRPPEILLGESNYDHSVDIWSLACVFYEMLTGKVLFKPSTSSDVSQLCSIFQICGSPNEQNWPGFDELPNSDFVKMMRSFNPVLRELLEQTIPSQFHSLIGLLESMLQLDPSKRINVQQALDHPFFSDDFVLPMLTHPEAHAMNVFSVNVPLAKNIERMKNFLRPERVLPPPILA
ncbi:CMGC family protein kinase [Tritrichomonas foetus]|uniref:CMGC family protein kinase n=1 Tax=Tritrichomonas foetus TaxID=1144522 RepID=A0A1J4JNH1_9EUKA|nr:CMGC family protein kinase [Tritrichomonas foetus]|eukprot:OHT00679.1 CMGC family protein kinase [Tritrichomonas foetus]